MDKESLHTIDHQISLKLVELKLSRAGNPHGDRQALSNLK